MGVGDRQRDLTVGDAARLFWALSRAGCCHPAYRG
jgi:hypothetical protein